MNPKEYRFLDQDGKALTEWQRIPAYGITRDVRNASANYPTAERIDVEIRNAPHT